MAATKPKFPMTENSRTYTVHLGQPLTLLCPAQAFPVPAFRYAKRGERSIALPRFLYRVRARREQPAEIPLVGRFANVQSGARWRDDVAVPGSGVPGSSLQVTEGGHVKKRVVG